MSRRPTQINLDFLQLLQQLLGEKIGFDLDHRIEKGRVTGGTIDGLGFEKGRNTHDRTDCQFSESLAGDSQLSKAVSEV
jgi:hypothetical protein